MTAAPAPDVLHPAAGAFDYSVPADLYFHKRLGMKWTMSFRRFDSAAAAIAFAVEELSATGIRLTTLEVDDERFDQRAIRRLYDAASYPLARAATAV